MGSQQRECDMPLIMTKIRTENQLWQLKAQKQILKAYQNWPFLFPEAKLQDSTWGAPLQRPEDDDMPMDHVLREKMEIHSSWQIFRNKKFL